MIIKKYHSIMEQPEEHRERWALGLAISLSVIIFAGFAFYKGYFSFGTGAASKPQTASVAASREIPSPIQSTKSSVVSAFEEVSEKYQEFKDSLSNVFVPFISGIEVYERD